MSSDATIGEPGATCFKNDLGTARQLLAGRPAAEPSRTAAQGID
jgi:hypothetical protein